MGTIIMNALALAAVAILFIISRKIHPKDEPANENSHHTNNNGKGTLIAFYILRGIAAFIVVCIVVINVTSSYQTVDSGHVKVAKVFGKINGAVISEGMNFPVNPFASWTTMNTQRNSIAAEDGEKEPGLESTTADNNQATVKANFGYALNPKYAWWVLREIGNEAKFRSEILEKAAQSATRDALGDFRLEDAQVKRRGEFEKALTTQFTENIIIQLPKKGLSEDEMRKVFIVFPVQLMGVKPDPKVSNALAEKKATEIGLENQKTLNSIEDQKAERRKAEGTGINNMFANLPKGYSAADVAMILEASADKERADALMKAVTDNKISFGMFEGSSARNPIK